MAVWVADFIRHKVTLFLSIDGNFRLQLKAKNRSPDDKELFSAFFVPSDLFDQYQRGIVDDLEVTILLTQLSTQ